MRIGRFLIFKTMTDKDKQLIEAAKEVPYTEWERVYFMEQEAESEEARQELHHICNWLAHMEEYHAGLL